MTRWLTPAMVAWQCVMVLGCAGGCREVNDFFKTDRRRLLAAEKVIDAPGADRSPISPILTGLGAADDVEELVPNATFPQEGDWGYTEEDYVIGPTDIVEVRILDLYGVGLETPLRREVSETGFIDLPLLPERVRPKGEVRAAGRSKEQLRQAIADAYSPEVLKDPTISVALLTRRHSTFSALGAVARPGPYIIGRKDLRLLDALAMAGGITQTNISYLYVIRPTGAGAGRPAAGEAPLPGGQELPPLPPIPPEALPGTPAPGAGETDLEKALRELGGAVPGTQPTTQPAEPPTPTVVPRVTVTEADGGGETEAVAGPPPEPTPGQGWRREGGRWVRVAEGPAATAPATAPAKTSAPPASPQDPFGWRRMDKSDLARIIAININKLKEGDPRMNIVIRSNDVIRVPAHEVGEFYVTGEVLRPGVYSLTGRRVTVKMAIAAAGNLGPLAWPENTILVRRIGDTQEQIIPLDLEAIFQGETPDIFLKPNDVLAVGTDARVYFYAVMRNAFRMTYGFGFIYDRNFADPLFTTPKSNRFTRW